MSFANKIVYIAGPITGRLDTYKQAFAKAEEYLASLGAVVLNPATLPIGLKSHQAYMNICLPMLSEAEVLALLPGWERSKGAIIAHGEAIKIGLQVVELVQAPANDNVPASGREADLSCPAVTERLGVATETVLAAVLGLMDDKYRFDRNDWFERGELPPVGAKCLYKISDKLGCEVEITAHAKFGICFVEIGKSGENYVSKNAERHRFRPIRNDQDKAAPYV